jgi:hypothetical protein
LAKAKQRTEQAALERDRKRKQATHTALTPSDSAPMRVDDAGGRPSARPRGPTLSSDGEYRRGAIAHQATSPAPGWVPPTLSGVECRQRRLPLSRPRNGPRDTMM